jgi:hypothetical protein
MPPVINFLNFNFENGFEIKNNHDPGISRILSQSNKTFSRPPQSRETVPLNLPRLLGSLKIRIRDIIDTNYHSITVHSVQ